MDATKTAPVRKQGVESSYRWVIPAVTVAGQIATSIQGQSSR